MNDRPTFLVIAGPNGAGKTTYGDSHSIGERIDPDAVAKRLNSADPANVAGAAARDALKRIDAALRERRDFTQETTLSSQQPLRAMQAAREAGFRVEVAYIGVRDVQRSLERVGARVEQGGHAIPNEAVNRRFSRSMENLPKAAAIANRTTIIDNNRAGPREVAVLEQGQPGKIATHVPGYFKSALEASEKSRALAHAERFLANSHEQNARDPAMRAAQSHVMRGHMAAKERFPDDPKRLATLTNQAKADVARRLGRGEHLEMAKIREGKAADIQPNQEQKRDKSRGR